MNNDQLVTSALHKINEIMLIVNVIDSKDPISIDLVIDLVRDVGRQALSARTDLLTLRSGFGKASYE